MPHEPPDIVIKDVLVFLVAAGLIVPALRAARLPTVAGFILAGVALGPGGFARLQDQWGVVEYLTISDPAAAAPFAELGVLFLLFLLGLELSFEKLWELRRIVLGVGTLQVAASAAAIAALAFATGVPGSAAIVVGLALALSSTAIVMQLLLDSRKTTTPVGRTALGVLLLQDIMVAPILIFAGIASVGASANVWGVFAEAFVEGSVAIVAIVLVGRFMLRRLFKIAAAAGGRDFLMALTLLAVVGAAVITASAGLSIALGAFLAGLLLGETEFKHQAEVDLEPFKGLLLGLFFMTVGFSLDLALIAEGWMLVLGGVVALLVIKGVIAGLAVHLFTRKAGLSVEAALLLAPAGEFAFVVFGAAMQSGLLDPETATLATAIAGVSMLLTPLSWRLGRWLGDRVSPGAVAGESASFPRALHGHAIVAGFGRVGRTVARILERERVDIVALDINPSTVSRERARGWRVYLGDSSRDEMLVNIGLHDAGMVIVTLDDPQSAERLVRAARRLSPAIPIFARARDADHAQSLIDAGASFVVPDAIEAGLQMSARALEEVGYAGEPVRDLIASERGEQYRRAR